MRTANITENTVAISQRFHVRKRLHVKVWKNHTLENPLKSQIRKSVYLYGTERIGISSEGGAHILASAILNWEWESQGTLLGRYSN